MTDANPVSTIAHKIRTPLTVIMSTVNNLIDGAFGAVTPIQHQWLKKLETHTLQLEHLMDEILQIMKDDPTRAQQIHNSMSGDLPVVHKKSQEAARHAELPTQESSLILVVDDEVDIQEVVQEGLGMQGYRVLAASNAEDGFALAMREKPDVILMDLFLKDQNGLELAGRIKSSAGQFIPIVMITGQDDLRDKIVGFQDKADDLLAKPFQIAELTIRVRSMLRLKKLSQGR